MANLIPAKAVDLDEKVLLMQQDARFDMADSQEAEAANLSSVRSGLRSAKTPPKVPKVFLSNNCIFNCAYCGCRSSNEGKRSYACSPRELSELSVRQAVEGKRGIFLTSAIHRSADYTQELLIETLRIIRRELDYRGYVHTKVMPGTDPLLIQQAGLYSNRLSVNIEVASSDGYRRIAKNKNKKNILTPMGQISALIHRAKEEKSLYAPGFATSQITQLMAGSTGEDDRTILDLSQALYKKYMLSRVYYTAFHYQDPAAGYSELPPMATPAWRVKRLYQADRLMELYGFSPDEITPSGKPFLSRELEPKLAWALRNLQQFPIEVNKADYELLLRIPGIGITYAKRILLARKYAALTHDTLAALGIPLGKSRHFLTCAGRYTGDTCDNEETLYNKLVRPPAGNVLGQLTFEDVGHTFAC